MEKLKILIRGGSISAGKGVDVPYPALLPENLTYDTEIINISKIGDTSFDAVWGFDEQVESFRPDMLLLHFGIDDAFKPVYRSEFKENLVQLVRKAESTFNPYLYLLTSHSFEDQYDTEIVNIYYRVIREVAVDLHCTMIPVHSYWAGLIYDKKWQYHELVQEDPRYPNDTGHKIYVEVISHYLNKDLMKLKK